MNTLCNPVHCFCSFFWEAASQTEALLYQNWDPNIQSSFPLTCHLIAPDAPVPQEYNFCKAVLDSCLFQSCLLAQVNMSVFHTLFLLTSPLIPRLHTRSWQSKHICRAAPSFREKGLLPQQTHLSLLGKATRADFGPGGTARDSAQRRGGVPIPGGIWETHECGTEGRGLVMGLCRSGWWLDLVTLKVFSNLSDPMVLK